MNAPGKVHGLHPTAALFLAFLWLSAFALPPAPLGWDRFARVQPVIPLLLLGLSCWVILARNDTI